MHEVKSPKDVAKRSSANQTIQFELFFEGKLYTQLRLWKETTLICIKGESF